MGWGDITGAFTVIGVFVAAYSIGHNTRRAQKELAVNLISEWARDYSMQMKHAFELARIIESSLIERITRYEPDVKVEGNSAVTAIAYILSFADPNFSKSTQVQQNTIQLTSDQCRIIDYQWMQTLHRIEAMLIAWQGGAADRKIMKRQFEPLIAMNKPLLKKLTMGDEYPEIKEYVRSE